MNRQRETLLMVTRVFNCLYFTRIYILSTLRVSL
jgi:hypothetical protein